MKNVSSVSIVAFVLFLLNVSFAFAYPVTFRVTSNVADFSTYIYKCSDSSCSQLAYVTNDYGGTVNEYSVAGSGTTYIAEYDFKPCYVSHMYKRWMDQTTGNGPWTYSISLTKKSGCNAAINSMSISAVNVTPGTPVIIDANVQSVFNIPSGAPSSVPDALKVPYYSANTNIILEIKDQSDNTVYTQTKNQDIFMSSANNASFSWTPTVTGQYTVSIRSNVPDCKCSSTVENVVSKTLAVTANNDPQFVMDSVLKDDSSIKVKAAIVQLMNVSDPSFRGVKEVNFYKCDGGGAEVISHGEWPVSEIGPDPVFTQCPTTWKLVCNDKSAPYSCTYLNLSHGETYDFAANMYDNAGNIEVWVDENDNWIDDVKVNLDPEFVMDDVTNDNSVISTNNVNVKLNDVVTGYSGMKEAKFYQCNGGGAEVVSHGEWPISELGPDPVFTQCPTTWKLICVDTSTPFECNYAGLVEGQTYDFAANVFDNLANAEYWIDENNNWVDDVTVRLNLVPTAAMTAAPTSGTAPLTVTFTCSATGGDSPLSYSLAFGDGMSTVMMNSPITVTHTYNNQGVYTAMCTVIDSNEDSDSEIATVTVEAQDIIPTATMVVAPTSGPTPLTVDFICDGIRGNAPLIYALYFGDGTYLTSMSPISIGHTYAIGGVYTAICRVTDADGDSDSEYATITAESADLVPTAYIIANPTEGLAPLISTITCEATGGDSPLTYTLNYGDGTQSSGGSPVTSVHTYAAVGTYTATCTATDADGDTSSADVTISVNAIDLMPDATINATPSNGDAPLTTTMICDGSGGNAPLTYILSFGDGSEVVTSSIRIMTSHTYSAAGTYFASCSAVDADGDGDTIFTSISVNQDLVPTAYISATPTSGTEPLAVRINCTGSGGDLPLSYVLNFGDGSAPVTSASPIYTTHMFNEGIYNPICQVFDIDGDMNGYFGTVTVQGKFQFNPELHENLGDAKSVIESEDLAALGDSQVVNDKGVFPYVQYLRFLPKESEFVDYTVDMDDDEEIPGDYLYIQNGETVYQYQLTFDTALQSDITGTALDDLIMKNIMIIGDDYRITDARVLGLNDISLTLMTGEQQDIISEKETKNYFVNGKSYEITALNVSNSTARFAVNGEFTSDMQKDSIYTLSDGTMVAVSSFIQGTPNSVEFNVGAEKIVLRDTDITSISNGSQELQVNEEQIDGADVNIRGINTGSLVRIYSIIINMTAEDDIYVPAGNKLSSELEMPQALFTQNWDIFYEGLADVVKNDIRVDPSSDTQYNLVFTNTAGDMIRIPWLYINATGTLLYGKDFDRDLIVYENDLIAENNYFILSDDTGLTHILQYKVQDASERILTFKDMATLEAIKISYDDLTSIGILSLDGTDFLINVSSTLYDDSPIWVDFNSDGSIDADEHATITSKGGGIIDITSFAPNEGYAGLTLTTPAAKIGDGSKGDEVLTLFVKGFNFEVDLHNLTGPVWQNFELSQVGATDAYEEMTTYGVKVIRQDDIIGPDTITFRYPEQQVKPLVDVIA